MHFSQVVAVASALALAPTAVVATQAAAAFVTVSSLDMCPNGAATTANKPGPKTVVTDVTCDKVKISHDMSVAYYNFDIDPVTKNAASCCDLKVYDNAGCIGFPTLKLPIEGPASDRCIRERYFDDDVKYISMQLECEYKPEDASDKGWKYGPKQETEHGSEKEEHAPKQEAEHGSQKEEHAPKQEAGNGFQKEEHAPKQEAEHGSQKEEHAPKQEAEHGSEKQEHAPKQEAEHGSEQGEQSPEEEAPERKAASPTDSLGLGDLSKVLGFP